MTVLDLIKLLEQYPPDMRVCLESYEAGYEDMLEENIYQRTMLMNVNTDNIGIIGQHFENDWSHILAKEIKTRGLREEEVLTINRL